MKLTFKSLISALALRTTLISISSLILITRTANGEGTFIASNKNITVGCNAHSISTNLAYLSIHMRHGLGLRYPQTTQGISMEETEVKTNNNQCMNKI